MREFIKDFAVILILLGMYALILWAMFLEPLQKFVTGLMEGLL